MINSFGKNQLRCGAKDEPTMSTETAGTDRFPNQLSTNQLSTFRISIVYDIDNATSFTCSFRSVMLERSTALTLFFLWSCLYHICTDYTQYTLLRQVVLNLLNPYV